MNISHGDTSLMVRYIQAFLQENYVSAMRVSGIYDEYTHEHLIDYLSTPNIKNSYEVSNILMDEFVELRQLFTVFFSPEEIEFTSKTKSQYVRDFIQNEDTYNDINEMAQSMGWKIIKYLSTENINTDKFKIILGTQDRINIIPNRDLLPMINLYNNRYLMNLGIDDGGNGEGHLKEFRIGIDDNKTKLSYTKAEPNTVYSIYHGYPNTVQLTLACYTGTSINIQSGDLVENVESVYLAPGQIYHYTTTDSYTPHESKLLLLQIPWSKSIEGTSYTMLNLKLGDFNLDSNVDWEDFYTLCMYKYSTESYGYYYHSVFYSDPQYTVEITPDIYHTYIDLTLDKRDAYIWDGEQYLYVEKYKEYLSYMDKVSTPNICTVNLIHVVENPTIEDITNEDIKRLYDYVNGTIKYLRQDEYGSPIYYREYNQPLDNSKIKYSNVIGITKGDFDSDYIPTEEFIQNHWSIHSKFIDFITLNAITPYSAEYDIRTIQRMLDYILANTEIKDEEGHLLTNRGPDGIYTQDLKDIIEAYQKSKDFTFRTGYIDSDTESILSKEAEEYRLYSGAK